MEQDKLEEIKELRRRLSDYRLSYIYGMITYDEWIIRKATIKKKLKRLK